MHVISFFWGFSTDCGLTFPFNLSNKLEGGVPSSQKIGLWRQKLSKTKVYVHSQHFGDAVPKSKPKAWKEFVIVDCQVDAAQKCGIDVERLVKQRLRRTSFGIKAY